jgi:acyl-CoA thioesterase I
MPDTPRPCETHPDVVSFKYPLPHLAQSLKRQRRTKIVAIGSSSTAGEGNIVPFPHRLELEMRRSSNNYGRMIDVLNRGFGGQEAQDELSRFEADVIGEVPALVIWQVGTNAVFHNEVYSPDEVAAAIAAGLAWLAGLAMDVVLIDLQYTTAIVQKIGAAEDMVSRISAAAEQAHVNVFRRFALMQRWCIQDGIPIAELTDPTDPYQLHMSEWATNCVTQALYGAIAGAPSPTV